MSAISQDIPGVRPADLRMSWQDFCAFLTDMLAMMGSRDLAAGPTHGEVGSIQGAVTMWAHQMARLNSMLHYHFPPISIAMFGASSPYACLTNPWFSTDHLTRNERYRAAPVREPWRRTGSVLCAIAHAPYVFIYIEVCTHMIRDKTVCVTYMHTCI